MDILNPQNLMLILKTLSGTQSKRGNQTEQKPIISRPVTLTNIPARAAFQNEMQAQSLNRLEQSVLMRELLNLPKDLKELLAMLTYKQASAEVIAKLLQSTTVRINPEIIQQLLETNSKEVINKLIRLIQQLPNNTQNYDQLKPLMALLSQIIPSRNSSPQEILTHLLLLYLPWLPLVEDQKIEVRFEKKKSGGSDDEKIAMVIYVSTINLGRFKVTIIIDKNNHLDIHIEHISEKNEHQSREETENNEKILEQILKILNSEIKEEKIQAKTYLSEVKQKNFKDAGRREVTISKVNSISPVVLVAAQKISRIILEADEKISLLEKRRIDASTF